MSGKSGVPSFDTPCVTARSNSPSVQEPIAAGVMFLAYRTPAGPRQELVAAGAERLRYRRT